MSGRARIRRLGAVLATALALSSCSGRAESQARCLPEDRATLVVVAGPSREGARLHRMRLCPPALRRIAAPRVASVAAHGDDIVVALAESEDAGGEQALARLDGGDAVPLDAAMPPAAAFPELDRRGRLAFVAEPPVEEDGRGDRLFVLEPGAARPVARYADRVALAHPTWAPDGALAVYRRPGADGERPVVVIVPPKGPPEPVPFEPAMPSPVNGEVSSLAWGDTVIAAGMDTVVDGRPTVATVLFVLGVGRQQGLLRWRAVAWAPDRARLLVQDESGTLGILEGPAYDTVRSLGARTERIYDAAWVE